MSDTTGNRPTDPTPENVAPATPPAPPVPPRPQAQWPAPGAAGYPTQPQQPQQPYGAPRPQVYAGQPQPGQPHPYGASFGPAAQPGQTQPTQPVQWAPAATGPTKTKQRSGAGRVAGLIVAAALVGGAAGLGGAYAGVNLFSPADQSPAAGPQTVTVNDATSVNQTTAIATKVVPSVVTIEASSDSGGGTGSGVIVSEDGYVVTNTHVVTLDGATADAAIRVTTSDGRVYDAEVVGTDPTYDLAVIKLVDASGLTPIDFADSSELNVGDGAVAVGAPLGLSNSVTTGIVSALNRSIEIASSAAPETGDAEDEGDSEEQQPEENGQEGPFFFDFGQGDVPQQATETIKIAVIQTDAAINPGNSGGALVDSEGKLIGINVAIATAGSAGASGSIGVGFSIPSDIVERVASELIENGVATHGLLGANVLDAASVEDATITGAYIRDVSPGGAAEAGDLQSGDIITAFNGVPVADATDITAQVRAAAGGSDATVTYVRDGKTETIDVTLGTLGE